MTVRPQSLALATILSLPALSGTPNVEGWDCNSFQKNYCLDHRGLTIGILTHRRDDTLFMMRTEPYSQRGEYFATAPIHSRETVQRCRNSIGLDHMSLFAALTEPTSLFQAAYSSSFITHHPQLNLQSQGIGIRLLMSPSVPFLDTIPISGHVVYGEEELRVGNGNLYRSDGSCAGSLDIQGLASLEVGFLDFLSEKDLDILLKNDRSVTQLRIKRQNGRTLEFFSRIPTITNRLARGHENLCRIGYTLSTEGENSTLDVKIHIKPLLPTFVSESQRPNYQNALLQRINGAIARKLDDKMVFVDLQHHRFYPLHFSVVFVNAGEDAEVQFFQDNHPECIADPAACWVTRPTTHMLSAETVENRIPHEFLHYLGAADEYPDSDDPHRATSDPSSLMFADGGELHPRHLLSVLSNARRLIGAPLIVMRMEKKDSPR